MPWYQQDGWTVLVSVLEATVSIHDRGRIKYPSARHPPFPFASAGAIGGHDEHNLDEQGMSLRKYISLTTFCTLPLLVDLTNVLLEIALLCESDLKLRFKLFIVADEMCFCYNEARVRY